MLAEPSTKRVIAFIDGQNLFHAAREAFGYTYPNYASTEQRTTSASTATTIAPKALDHQLISLERALKPIWLAGPFELARFGAG